MGKANLARLAVDVINQWVIADKIQIFPRKFLFGSLVHKNADQFNETSDVDLAYLFPADDDALTRFSALVSLLDHLGNLETSLLRTLQRADASSPIASHCVLTPTEATLGIHKDCQPKLLTTKRFVELPWQPETGQARVALTASLDHEFLHSNPEPADIFAFVQKLRNDFLSMSPNGMRKMKDSPVQDDPIPKYLARKAATLAWFDGQTELDDREDLSIGLEYYFDTIIPSRSRDARIRTLRDKIGVRRGARGTKRPLTQEDIILLGELLFDAAKRSVKPSLTQKLSRAAQRLDASASSVRRMTGKNQK